MVRHGQTDSNKENRIQGHANTHLSKLGHIQARLVGEWLQNEQIDAIYSSDLNRAYETAEAIAGYHNLPIYTDGRFRECCFGEWEGKTVDEVKAEYPVLFDKYCKDSIKNRAPGGERLEELQLRVIEAVSEIVRQHSDDTVALVTHGGPVKALICYILGAEFTAFKHLGPDNCGVSIMICTSDNRWYLDTLNDTCHLAGITESTAGEWFTRVAETASVHDVE
ncbi:MAG: histidine phosphatase family protein [Armatimonadota bacterium]